MKGLFGDEVTEGTKKVRGKFKSILSQMGYRQSEGEEKCKICGNSFRVAVRTQYYYKCRRVGDSRSAASDIKASGVCWYYKK